LEAAALSLAWAINHGNNLPQDVVDHLKSLNQDCIFTKEIPSLKQKICIWCRNCCLGFTPWIAPGL